MRSGNKSDLVIDISGLGWGSGDFNAFLPRIDKVKIRLRMHSLCISASVSAKAMGHNSQ